MVDLEKLSGHTPGPWSVWDGPSYVGGGRDLCIGAGEDWLANMAAPECRRPNIGPDGSHCALLHSHVDICVIDTEITAVQEANARLIAAAPDLLAEVRALRSERDALKESMHRIVNETLRETIHERDAALARCEALEKEAVERKLDNVSLIDSMGRNTDAYLGKIRPAFSRIAELEKALAGLANGIQILRVNYCGSRCNGEGSPEPHCAVCRGAQSAEDQARQDLRDQGESFALDRSRLLAENTRLLQTFKEIADDRDAALARCEALEKALRRFGSCDCWRMEFQPKDPDEVGHEPGCELGQALRTPTPTEARTP